MRSEDVIRCVTCLETTVRLSHSRINPIINMYWEKVHRNKWTKGASPVTRDQEEFPASETKDAQTKKPYTPPELIVHGAVERLTEHTGQGGQNEQGLGNHS